MHGWAAWVPLSVWAVSMALNTDEAKMQFRLIHIVLGVLVIVLAISVAMVGLWRNFHPRSHATVPYVLVTDGTVPGVRAGSPVLLRGVLVGSVRAVGFDRRNPRLIRVRIAVLPGTPVFRGAHAEISAIGIGSDISAVELVNDSNSRQRLATSPGQPAIIAIRPPAESPMTTQARQAMQDAGRVVKSAQSVMSQENRARLVRMQEQLQVLTAQAKGMEQQWHATSAQMPALGAETRQTLAQARRLNENTQALAQAARRSTLALGEKAAAVTRQLKADQQMLQTQWQYNMAPSYAGALDSAQGALHGMRALADELQAHPGSVVLGKPAPGPDPGEPGFAPGASTEQPQVPASAAAVTGN